MIMNVDGTSLWNIAGSEIPKVTGILVTRVTHSENRKSHSVGMAMRCRIDLIKSNPLHVLYSLITCTTYTISDDNLYTISTSY